MKKLLAIVALLASQTAMADMEDVAKIVYGKDGRKDVATARYSIFSSKRKFKKLAKATAALFPKSRITLDASGKFYKLSSSVRTLGARRSLCPGQQFANQPSASICSGFLVSKDILLTAGHCSSGDLADVCKNYVWVFGYQVQNKKNPTDMKIPVENVVTCNEIVESQLHGFVDHGILRLSKKIEHIKPLKFKTKADNKLKKNTKLVVIGNPSGLPTKIATGGKLKIDNGEVYFQANLDTFGGNSGSAIFNQKTGLVEGILVRGRTDYHVIYDRNAGLCRRVNACRNNGTGCTDGQGSSSRYESVSKITYFMDSLQKAIKGEM